MRCPRCGGLVQWFLTDIKGRSFYRCTTGLTQMFHSIRSGFDTHVVPCDTVVDDRGLPYHGWLAYRNASNSTKQPASVHSLKV